MNTQQADSRRNILPRIVAGCIAGLATTFVTSEAAADVVTDWNAIATATVVAAAPAERPAFGLYVGLVQAAVYDAVNSIDRSYTVFAVKPDTFTHGASKEAAAAAAAYRMLSSFFPSRQASLDASYASSLAAIADGNAKARGLAIGTEVANKLLARRADDGRFANVTYTFGSGPGVYQPTPGAPPTAPITPWLAQVKPLVMKKPSQFRGDGPPALTSAEYATDIDETQRLGRLNSVERAAWQTQIGKFHTMNPNLFWGNNLNAFVVAQGLSLAENARLLALLWVSGADSTIACWDGKFAFNRWRPVTAIVNADTDGNPETIADAGWLPQETTPPHQEYPAGHGCATGAFMESLRQFFGTKRLHLAITSTATSPASTQEYFHTDDVLEEVVDARVYGGMHLRTSTEDGQAIGKRVAKLVAREHFQPKHRRHSSKD